MFFLRSLILHSAKSRLALLSSSLSAARTSAQRHELHLKANFDTGFSLHRLIKVTPGAFKLWVNWIEPAAPHLGAHGGFELHLHHLRHDVHAPLAHLPHLLHRHRRRAGPLPQHHHNHKSINHHWLHLPQSQLHCPRLATLSLQMFSEPWIKLQGKRLLNHFSTTLALLCPLLPLSGLDHHAPPLQATPQHQCHNLMLHLKLRLKSWK